MGILISAKNAPKKMLINIGRITWKGFVNMTGSVENLQSVLLAIQKLQERGEQKIKEGSKPTRLLLRGCDMELFLKSHVVDAETKKALLTTMITISR
jgi:hypothetical protein